MEPCVAICRYKQLASNEPTRRGGSPCVNKFMKVNDQDNKGKRSVFGVEQNLPTTYPELPGDNLQRLPIVIDSFGAINILLTDKFGAVEFVENQSSSFGSTFSRPSGNVEDLTGSFTPIHDGNTGDGGKCQHADASLFVNESGLEEQVRTSSAATSFNFSSRLLDEPQSHSSTVRFCTLDERTSISGRDSPLKRFCNSSTYDVPDKRTRTRHVQFETVIPISAQGNASNMFHDEMWSPSKRSKQIFDPKIVATSTPHGNLSTDETKLQPLLAGSPLSFDNIVWPLNVGIRTSKSLDLNELPKSSAVAESSRSSENCLGLDDGSREGFIYKFTADREAFLSQQMEERQRIQDATPVVTSLPKSHGAEHYRHVVSPEDLVWVSVKNYCGMVLDRETRALLGTAVLFVPPNTKIQKSAWVTSMTMIEGRCEILIKDSKGEIHVAKLMLTSTAFGLAFFSVPTRQQTFALAFLSMVTGPTSQPHRLFVDVDRGDRVYVFGYEVPWESEAGKIADVRVRPGKITEAGNNEIVEIDFTKGQLGGSIVTPASFRGGLVARADGLWAGLITGQTLPHHPTLIDYSSAYVIHSFLEEL